ncbi:hypothetical protein GCM10028791_25970 [Echinicola sediminis]
MPYIQKTNCYFGIKKWFYIHYNDSKYHLRLRIKVPKSRKKIVEKELYFYLNKCEEVQYFKTVPYSQEWKKYSRKDMSLSESLFHQESDFVLNSFPDCPLLAPEHNKIALAIQIGKVIIKTNHCYIQWQSGFKKEYKAKELSKRKLLQKWYSELKKEISHYRIDQNFLFRYSKTLKEHQYYQDKHTAIPLMNNHLHLFINRLFPENYSSEVEEVVRYGIYREIFREVYVATNEL